MTHRPWIRTLVLGFFVFGAGPASADPTFSISDLFGANAPSGAEVIQSGGSFGKMTDQARYQFLWNYCRGYSNDLSANAAAQTDCATIGISPCDCGSVKVMGTVERAGVPDSLGSMNKFVVLPSNGARRIGALNVSSAGIVSVPSGSLGSNECGIVNLSYYRGSSASPFSRCDSARIVCGADVLNPPSVNSTAPSCAPIALVAGGGGGGGGGGGTCTGTTASASECTANAANFCPGQTVIDNCNRACASSYVGTKSTGCGGGNPSQMLIGGVHSVSDCTSAGGTVVYESVGTATYLGTSGSMPTDNGFCKFSAGACPSGTVWWSKYKDYRATGASFSPAAQMAAANAQAYNEACSTPYFSSFLGQNINVRAQWVYGPSQNLVSGFKNGPANTMTVQGYSFIYSSCDGSDPNPAAPSPPPLLIAGLENHFRNLRNGVDDLFDLLFPSAYAKASCLGTLSCAEKQYSETINLPTTEIGCY
ncbi:MAG: hypothetical protein JST04_05710 [Bdellovibrionales bacterium]|nr:hypothetical protein [Bdellovibrionales bacterium]